MNDVCQVCMDMYGVECKKARCQLHSVPPGAPMSLAVVVRKACTNKAQFAAISETVIPK